MHSEAIVRAGFVPMATALLLGCSGPSDSTLQERAAAIHEQAIVIDAHAHAKPHEAETLDLGEKTGAIEVDFITMKEGGLDAIFFSVPLLGGAAEGPPDEDRLLDDVGSIVEEVERYLNLAEIALSPGDIERIHAVGKRAVLLGMETQDPFGGDPGAPERFFEAGVRMITLTPEILTTPETGQNDRDDSSLSSFGRHVIEEMNRFGMISDISHLPDGLQMEVIRISEKPVVASHSNTRALNNIPRQIPDSIIRTLSDNGGVICVTFFPGHVSSGFPDQPVTIEDLVDHIDHVVQVAGADHVGFGSDFLGGDNHTIGLESAAGLPAITYALLERGYPRAEIEKILGGNLLRVFEAVQETGGLESGDLPR